MVTQLELTQEEIDQLFDSAPKKGRGFYVAMIVTPEMLVAIGNLEKLSGKPRAEVLRQLLSVGLGALGMPVA